MVGSGQGATWGECAYSLAFDVEVVVSHVGVVGCGRGHLCKGDGCGSRAPNDGEVE